MLSKIVSWLIEVFVPNQEQTLLAIRWLITAIGAWAVGKGYITSDQVTLFLGIAVAFAPLIWGVISKTQASLLKSASKVPDVKVVVGPNAPDSAKALAANPAAPNVVQQPGS